MYRFHFAMSNLKRTRSLEVVGSDAIAIDEVYTQVANRKNKKSRKGKTAQSKDIIVDVAATAGTSSSLPRLYVWKMSVAKQRLKARQKAAVITIRIAVTLERSSNR